MIDLTQRLLGIIRTKACSVKPFKGATESKTINLRIDYSEITIGDILTKAVSHDVIAWQNGQGRKNYKSLTANSTVLVKAKSPGAAPQVDPEEAMVARLKAMTPEARAAWFAAKMAETETTIEDEDEDEEDV